jgi:hypothetical protein
MRRWALKRRKRVEDLAGNIFFQINLDKKKKFSTFAVPNKTGKSLDGCLSLKKTRLKQGKGVKDLGGIFIRP